MRDEELRRRLEYAAWAQGQSPAQVVEEVADDREWYDDDQEWNEDEHGAATGEEEEKPRSWPRTVARYTACVVVGVILGFGIIGAMKFVNDPVVAKGTALGATASVAPAPGTAHTSALQGLNFSFSYSGMFDQVAQVKSGSQMIEQYNLTSKASTAHQVAVGLESIKPGGGLDDISDWSLRKNRSSEYSPRLEKSGSDIIGIMAKNDKTEESMFWIHGNKVLEVSVTTTDPKDDVDAILTVIKGSMKWRK